MDVCTWSISIVLAEESWGSQRHQGRYPSIPAFGVAPNKCSIHSAGRNEIGGTLEKNGDAKCAARSPLAIETMTHGNLFGGAGAAEFDIS
jgi:hypothetical protein